MLHPPLSRSLISNIMYHTTPANPYLPSDKMSTTFQIVTKGCVYVSNRRELTFEVTMERVHKILEGKSKASTFDALHDNLARKWLLRDEVVKPFGDKRQNLRFVCTFDLNEDLLLYSDESSHIKIPLARLRNPVFTRLERSEFISYELPTPPSLDLTEFPPPYQNIPSRISDRRFGFTSRILLDFADQWRHILRSSYAESTFRRFAKAIISIVTCDFQVDEISTKQYIVTGGFYVTVIDVPTWEPYDLQMFNVGDTSVILNQNLRTALNFAKNEANAANKLLDRGSLVKPRTYLLLSVRYMMVCRMNSTGAFSYTAPETLMNGFTPPSSSATNLLLQVLQPSPRLPFTPLHNLPLEVQDRILQHLSLGSIESARLGCVLDLGSRFTWMRSVDWPRQGGRVELFTSPSHRSEYNAVESKICFEGVFSGLSYR